MNFKRREKSIVDILFLLALFAVFLISALFIVLFGAKIYKNTVSNMEKNFTYRTSLSYVTEKVRQHDYDGGIVVSEYDGEPLLIFNQFYDDKTYCTYLYEDNGCLKEFTANEDYEFTKDAGQEIIQVNDFSVDHITRALFKCKIESTDGNKVVFYVSSYSYKDGGVIDE